MAENNDMNEPSTEPGAGSNTHSDGQQSAQPTSYGAPGYEQQGYDQQSYDQQQNYSQQEPPQQGGSPQEYSQQGYAAAPAYGGASAYGSTPAYGTQSYATPAYAQDSAYATQPAAYPAGASFSAPAEPETKRGHSTGTFLAGLAVAALIGGAVGGGVSALITENSASNNASSVVQHNGTVTLNNPKTATDITGVAAVATPSVVTVTVESSTASGSGSGVIYSADGYIITNAHVATLDGEATNPKIRVTLSDGRIFEAKVVGLAPYSDIAVLQIKADGLTPIKVADSSKVNVGDLAVAIGAPLALSNTVTSGVVSALNRGISVGSALIPQDPSQKNQQGDGDSEGGSPWDFRFDNPDQNSKQNTQSAGGQVTLPVIQTDASINPGNSGGALLNGKGELIGINVAIMSPGASNGTASSAGLGFAIPSELATRVADEIIAGKHPSHGLLGASVVDSNLDTDADANHTGGLIKELTRDGAAEKAGLKVGDVITAVDGIPAADGTSVSALIRMHAGSSTVTIDYTRGGKAGEVTATLGTLQW